MCAKIIICSFLFFTAFLLTAAGQDSLLYKSTNACISIDQYKIIEKQCQQNVSLLNHRKYQKPSTIPVLFSWPLRSAQSFTDCSYYYISAYVDHDNSTTTFKDYNCGGTTYNGHKGTDIAIGPFPFYKMENNQVEVIAAAAGTIINKNDGAYDRNCVGIGSNLSANYIILQHADGSYSLYWHMKSGKITQKNIGQTVEAGEYLGVVGSSGSSSGPHLHFEVWLNSSNTSYIDPFAGTCNTASLNSRWLIQKPYREPSVIKASIHTTDYIPPTCGTTETLKESTIFVTPFQGMSLAAGFAKFYVFFRNETAATSATMNILNPDASVFSTWTQSFTQNRNFSTYGYSKKLPITSGLYTFQAIYNGNECTQRFEIRTCAENYNAWYGTTSDNWHDQTNWSCEMLPTNSSHVIIYSGVPNNPVINSNADCKSLHIFPSANVKVNTGGNLKIYH